MAKVTFDTDLCKGCGLCVDACNKNLVKQSSDKINSKGYHPASVENMEECIACGMCATMCPDCVITVEK